MNRVLRAVVGRVLLVLLAGYRILVSSWMPPRCRFAPSCSAYASEAIRLHGAWVGGRLAVVRVARCHPWHPGGYDPVPEHPGDRPGRSSNHSPDHPA